MYCVELWLFRQPKSNVISFLKFSRSMQLIWYSTYLFSWCDVIYQKRAGVFDHDIKTREGIWSSRGEYDFLSAHIIQVPKGITTVNKCRMYFECFIPLAHAFNRFSYEIFLIWTSFCPTFIYYFDKTLNAVENSSYKKAIGTGFFKLLPRAFTISLKLGFIPCAWKVAVLCMLIKPDKLPSQTTSYRPISSHSAIMKLFKRVIDKRLRKHLEDNGFFSKYQSGFRKSKLTNDHLFRLSLRP